MVESHFGTEAAAGLTAILVKAGAVTVRVTLFEAMPLAEALIVVAPCAREDTIPVSFIVATELLEDAHTTAPETSAAGVPSEKVPTALNISEVPLGVDSAVEEIVIPFNNAVLGITVRLAPEEVMPPAEAVTVVEPRETPVTKPVALFIVAIAESPIAQVT